MSASTVLANTLLRTSYVDWTRLHFAPHTKKELWLLPIWLADGCHSQACSACVHVKERGCYFRLNLSLS